MKNLLVILTFSFTCMFSMTGCEIVSELLAPKFDASSTEAFEKSYTNIKKTLSEEEIEKLNNALLYHSAIYLKDHPKEALIAGAAALIHDDADNSITKSFSSDLMKTFDGKTAKQVIKEYEKTKNQ